MTKKAKLPLLKDKIVKNYLDPYPKDMQKQIIDSWLEIGEELKGIINEVNLDFHHLGALVDIIRNKRNEDHHMRGHAVKIKNNYRGAEELKEFIEGYKNKNFVPNMISIDFKPLYKNGDKSKPLDKERFNSQSSTVLKIKGKEVIKLLMSQITAGTLDAKLKVYSDNVVKPPIKIEDYPNKKI